MALAFNVKNDKNRNVHFDISFRKKGVTLARVIFSLGSNITQEVKVKKNIINETTSVRIELRYASKKRISHTVCEKLFNRLIINRNIVITVTDICRGEVEIIP